MKKVLVTVCHGVELELGSEYCTEFIDDIVSRVPAVYRDYVHFHQYDWNILVSDRQQQTFEMEEDLGASGIRKKVISLACDILWYRASKGTSAGMDIYQQIHRKLETEIDVIKEKHKTDELVGIGHSWGTQVLLDHAFETKHHIKGLFTMGSPITKVAGMYPDWGHLPEKKMEFWINFYANRDLVASWFKKHKSQAFRDFVEDVRIKSWNPIDLLFLKQHVLYWKSPTVKQKIADSLVKFLAAS